MKIYIWYEGPEILIGLLQLHGQRSHESPPTPCCCFRPRSWADILFLQICLQMGFRRKDPWLYLSGDNPELLDVYPELGYLRDIVYLLKAFMAPTSDALPEVGAATGLFLYL